MKKTYFCKVNFISPLSLACQGDKKYAKMDHFFSPNSEIAMDDTWLQQTTFISLTSCQGIDHSIFVYNIFVKFYG